MPRNAAVIDTLSWVPGFNALLGTVHFFTINEDQYPILALSCHMHLGFIRHR